MFTILLLLIPYLTYLCIKYYFSYWNRKAIVNVESSFYTLDWYQLPQFHFYSKIYNRLKGHRFGGCFFRLKPKLVILDPELIKHVLTKDFDHFQDRNDVFFYEQEPITMHLFNVPGQLWRELRTKLTPTFTSGKMKYMFSLVQECAEELTQTIAPQVTQKGTIFEVKDFSMRYTIDVISSCAFGLKAHAIKDGDSPFVHIAHRIFENRHRRHLIAFFSPRLKELLGLKVFHSEVSEFFFRIIRETVQYRKESGFVRNDFLQLLIKLNDDKQEKHKLNEATQEVHKLNEVKQEEQNLSEAKQEEQKFNEAKKEEQKLNESKQQEHNLNEAKQEEQNLNEAKQVEHNLNEVKQEEQKSNQDKTENQKLNEDKQKSQNNTELSPELMTAQCFVFFLAGFDTSSTVQSFTLLELAKNPEVQRKLQKEIDEYLAKYDGTVTYEMMKDMPYLHQVLSETMRKYPVLASLNRTCVKRYKIPGSEHFIEIGTDISVPVSGLHTDPEYYPDPEKYDPDRFSEKEISKRHRYVYLPFGEGPRNCIAARFGLMSVKLGIINLLKNFNFELTSRTKYPIEFIPHKSVTDTSHSIILKLTTRLENNGAKFQKTK